MGFKTAAVFDIDHFVHQELYDMVFCTRIAAELIQYLRSDPL
jgi:hypothetical protein